MCPIKREDLTKSIQITNSSLNSSSATPQGRSLLKCVYRWKSDTFPVLDFLSPFSYSIWQMTPHQQHNRSAQKGQQTTTICYCLFLLHKRGWFDSTYIRQINKVNAGASSNSRAARHESPSKCFFVYLVWKRHCENVIEMIKSEDK